MSSKKAIRSYLVILKCSLAIWQLRSLTVEISDVPCTGKVVSLSPGRLAPFDFFWKPNPSSRKASIYFSEEKVKFAMLIKFYPSP